jgi:hypothetical protein
MNTSDRCDRCGAEARVRVLFAGENILDFCQHHANEYSDAIVNAGGVVIEPPYPA